MRKMIFTVLALATVLDTPANAQKLMIDHPDWDLYETTGGAGGCFVQQEYENGGSVTIDTTAVKITRRLLWATHRGG